MTSRGVGCDRARERSHTRDSDPDFRVFAGLYLRKRVCKYVCMRRNLTISFESGFIERMDFERGEAGLSRGRWLEEKGLRPNPDVKAPAPVVERSPEPAVDSGVSREPSEAVEVLVTEDVKVRYDEQRERVGMPPIRRHSPTCSCGVCKPVKL